MLRSAVRSIKWPVEETNETLEQQPQSKAAGPDRISLRVLQHLYNLLQHCENHMVIFFVCFCLSAIFNTIQLLLLSEGLLALGVTISTVSWIADYLSEWPQFVQQGGVRKLFRKLIIPVSIKLYNNSHEHPCEALDSTRTVCY